MDVSRAIESSPSSQGHEFPVENVLILFGDIHRRNLVFLVSIMSIDHNVS